MTITFTAKEWRAFKSGKEVIKRLKALGMESPRDAIQKRNADGSVTFEDRA
jgi:hypothetical protein